MPMLCFWLLETESVTLTVTLTLSVTVLLSPAAVIMSDECRTGSGAKLVSVDMIDIYTVDLIIFLCLNFRKFLIF